jgi:NADH:ubiquinone oxidoreductase subunit 2 (subunit N)
MMLFSLILSSFGDAVFFNGFFNYSLYCYFNILFSFFIEFNLFFFILFNILCIPNHNKNVKSFFYFFIGFLSFLMMTGCLFCWLNINFFLINFSLQNNYFIFISKIICLFLLINILYILKNKLLYTIYNFFFKEFFCILSFLLIFICILLSSVDFFIMFLSLEGISFVLYTLGTILHKSYINLEAIIKYFLINNIASSLLL